MTNSDANIEIVLCAEPYTCYWIYMQNGEEVAILSVVRYRSENMYKI